jgi:DNA-binding transcriptional MocR family regulator
MLSKGTRISRPAGGHMLWIEVPAKIEAMKLWRSALCDDTVFSGFFLSIFFFSGFFSFRQRGWRP